MASHQLLSNWYSQLAVHLASGIPLPDAFRVCAGPPESGRTRIAEALQRGDTVEQALAQAPGWLPLADRRFIVAAAETGRLPDVLQRLSERHAAIGANLRKVLLGLAYPLIIYHLAAMVAPVISMIDYEAGFQWSFTAYFGQTLLWLGPVWLLGAFFVLMKARNVTSVFRVLDYLPLLRRYRKKQALANFSFALSIFLKAGTSIGIAWREAAELSGSSAIRKASIRILETITQGGDPRQPMADSPVFPADFRAFYSAGALSGKLEESLFNAGAQLQTQANTAATVAAIIYPGLLFLVIAGRIAFIIFSSFRGYLEMLTNMFA